VQSTKPGVEKYRRFTGRRGAPNTGKVIETVKEKARAPNWRVTGAETGKTGQMNRAIAPVSGRSTPHQKEQSEIRACADASPGHIDTPQKQIAHRREAPGENVQD
jgi:hypothetical protein